MFRHQGKNRTFAHNLRLATLLSMVAGIVNSTGVLSIHTLTTNVTGHFAFFAEEFFKENYQISIVFFVFTIFFFFGAFTSNVLAEIVVRKSPDKSHFLPIALEICILTAVALITYPINNDTFDVKYTAFALLFAMGIQNALVTKISQSTVRTTHLTGLFTDLGIEVSQLFFYKKIEEKKRLKATIYLRLSIILSFFCGCILGAFSYNYFNIKTLLIAVILLVVALIYDYTRLKLIEFKRTMFLKKL